MAKRLARTRRCIAGNGAEGFTLIELMIVILILAILVGIAVAVMFIAKRRASSVTAQSNNRIGEKCMENAWFRCMEGIYAYYRDSNSAALGAGANQYVYGRYMSYMEPKINWADLSRSGSNFIINQSSTAYGLWKNKVRSTVTDTTDMTVLQGKIAITAYYPTNAAGTTWSASASNNYRTVIALDVVSHRAYFTCYYLGRITRSGNFGLSDTGVVSP